jgi:hypothetical protein
MDNKCVGKIMTESARWRLRFGHKRFVEVGFERPQAARRRNLDVRRQMSLVESVASAGRAERDPGALEQIASGP